MWSLRLVFGRHVLLSFLFVRLRGLEQLPLLGYVLFIHIVVDSNHGFLRLLVSYFSQRVLAVYTAAAHHIRSNEAAGDLLLFVLSPVGIRGKHAAQRREYLSEPLALFPRPSRERGMLQFNAVITVSSSAATSRLLRKEAVRSADDLGSTRLVPDRAGALPVSEGGGGSGLRGEQKRLGRPCFLFCAQGG